MRLLNWAVAMSLAVGGLAYAGGDVAGNGGAGTVVDGHWGTFFESGYYDNHSTQPPPLIPIQSVPGPGVSILKNFIRRADFLASSAKTDILHLIDAGPDHVFYQITEDQLNRALANNLIEHYSRVMNIPPESLKLFAITDTSVHSTYLLPAFFQLPPNGQAAILFHELQWLRHPHATYADVIEWEMATEALLDQPQSLDRRLRLLDDLAVVGDATETAVWKTALKRDVAAQAIGSLVDSHGTISLQTLLGTKSSGARYDNNNIDYQARLHPGSAFMRRLNRYNMAVLTVRMTIASELDVFKGNHRGSCQLGSTDWSQNSTGDIMTTIFDHIKRGPDCTPGSIPGSCSEDTDAYRTVRLGQCFFSIKTLSVVTVSKRLLSKATDHWFCQDSEEGDTALAIPLTCKGGGKNYLVLDNK